MRKLIITLSTLLVLAAPLAAQDLESGYFLGGNPFAFRLNPAFQSERNLISIGLGMTGAGATSNLGINTLFYPDATGERVYSFLNDHVSADELLRKLHNQNYLGLDAQVNVLTVGFWSGRSFFTVDFNLRNSDAVALPYDLFRFLKGDKSEGAVFECKNMGFQSSTFAEAALGWSYAFDDSFKVGARFKVLMGILGAEARMRRMQVEVHEDSWKVDSQGSMTVSSPAVTVTENKETGNLEKIDFDWNRFGPAGWGGAVDLGVSWEVTPLLTLSGALLDLGAIRWNREVAYATPEAAYEWTPTDTVNSFSDNTVEMEDLATVAGSLFNWQAVSNAGAAFAALPFRMNLGAEFRMPFYDRLSLGALYQGRFVGAYGRHTGRMSVNWNPLDFLSMSTGMTVSRLGESFSFALNLHPTTVNLILGCDYIPFRYVDVSPLFDDLTPQQAKYARLPKGRLNLNLYVGLNIAFGKSRLDHAKRFISE